jgi:hypothetical protein
MHTRAPITLRSRTIAIALLVAMVALQMAGLRELLAAPSTAAQASANQSPAAQQSASQKPTAQSAASAIPAAQVPSGKNLIINGDLSKGAGDAPDHWRTEGWEQKGDVTSYAWMHPLGQPAEIEVNSTKPNDARWMQAIDLEPGWYYLGAQVRTESVGNNATGASISIMEDGAMSHDVRGNTPWRDLGFYLKVGNRGGDIEIACRLGGYASLNTGRAYFRDVKIIPVAAPPAGEPQFDLDTVRKESAEPPVGAPWTLAATFVLLGAIAYFGWTMFGNPVPAVRQDRIVEREQPKRTARRS